MTHLKGRCLVQKRHLLGAAFFADLGGCLADEVRERAGEVRLIVVACLHDGVEDRDALLQEIQGVAGTLDLTGGALREAGCSQETTLDGAERPVAQMALYGGIYDWIAREQALAHQPINKRLGVVIGGELPGGAEEPEGVFRDGGEVYTCVHQGAGREMRQKRAQLEDDANPLAVVRTVAHGRSFGLGPAHCDRDLALKSAHHQLTVGRGNGEKGCCALAVAPPDPFDKGRVGWSTVVKEEHGVPHLVCEAVCYPLYLTQ